MIGSFVVCQQIKFKVLMLDALPTNVGYGMTNLAKEHTHYRDNPHLALGVDLYETLEDGEFDGDDIQQLYPRLFQFMKLLELIGMLGPLKPIAPFDVLRRSFGNRMGFEGAAPGLCFVGLKHSHAYNLLRVAYLLSGGF